MKKLTLITSMSSLLILASFISVSNAQVVTFESPDYTVQNNLAEGALIPGGTGLTSEFNNLDGTLGAQIIDVSGDQKLQINSGTANNSNGWVKDISATTLTGNDIFRSLDLNISNDGAGRGFTMGLVSGSIGGGGSISVSDINPNSLLQVNFNTFGNIIIRRQASTGTEAFNGTAWVTNANAALQGYTLNQDYSAQFSFIDATDTLSLTLLEGATQLTNVSFNISELDSGITTSARFYAGEPFSNSANGAVFTLDNISTVPEPSTYALLSLGALAILITYHRKKKFSKKVS